MERPSVLALALACLVGSSSWSQQVWQPGETTNLGRLAGLGNRHTAGIAIEFEKFANGEALAPDVFGQLFTLTALGGSAGPAVFDSTIGGPNDPGPDPDLLVGKGNVLILQDGAFASQTVPGVFDTPNDHPDGGTVVFEFVRPVRLQSIDLIDVDLGGGDLFTTAIDSAGRTRATTVLAGFTEDISLQGPPGFRRLSLGNTDEQPGTFADSTTVEQAGFEPNLVVRLEISYIGSVGLDRLLFTRSSALLKCKYPVLNFPGDSSTRFLDVATADLDGDGDQDVVAPDEQGNEIYVFQNRGDGTFAEPATFGTGPRPVRVDLADFDGDGILDVAALNREGPTFGADSSSLSILRNLGNGSFAPHVEYVVAEDCESLVTGDFNLDGAVDVVIGPRDGMSDEIFVLLNGGDGTMSVASSFTTGSIEHGNLMTGDMDGDGDLDLIRPDTGSDELEVWTNLGNATFVGPALFDTGEESQDGRVVDYDLDGNLDVVLATDRLTSLRGSGNAALGPPDHFGSILNGSASFRSVDVADLDGDGDPDPVLSGQSGNRALQLFDNPGDGNFIAEALFDGGVGSSVIEIVDLSGDGAPELIYPAGGLLKVLKNRGDLTFQLPLSFAISRSPRHSRAVDIDSDGSMDVVSVSDEDAVNFLNVSIGDGAGSLAPGIIYPSASRPNFVSAALLDSDSWPDVAVLSTPSDVLFIHLNSGDGTLAPPDSYPTSDAPLQLCDLDWDDDNDRDLAIICRNSIDLLANLGNGKFTVHGALPTTNGAGIAAGDWNQDGNVDLVITRFSIQNSADVYWGDGTGSFTAGQRIFFSLSPRNVIAGDLDGDGFDDLFVSSTGSVAVTLNDGAGQFTGPVHTTISNIGSIEFPEFGDLDDDGDLDVALPGKVIGLLWNDGTGSMSLGQLYGSGSQGNLSIADMNSDGRLDIVSNRADLNLLLIECD